GFVPFIQAGPAIIALHLEPGGIIPEHEAPHPIICIMLRGSGFVRVGGPHAPTQAVQAGDAVLWPPNVLHAAWATDDQMDMLTVEYAPELATP
nr:cupin domain-containing protein [Ktedonobacterales bacterium]